MKFIALKNPKKYNLNDFPSFIVVFSYGGRRGGGTVGQQAQIKDFQ